MPLQEMPLRPTTGGAPAALLPARCPHSFCGLALSQVQCHQGRSKEHMQEQDKTPKSWGNSVSRSLNKGTVLCIARGYTYLRREEGLPTVA